MKEKPDLPTDSQHRTNVGILTAIVIVTVLVIITLTGPPL
jgi:hypothetical protein